MGFGEKRRANFGYAFLDEGKRIGSVGVREGCKQQSEYGIGVRSLKPKAA